MLDRHRVKRFQAVNDTKALPVLLEYAEPPRTVGRVRGLVHSGVDLLFDYCADLLVDTGRDRYILQHPGGVRDDWELDWGKEVLAETSALGVVPREGALVLAHEVVEEVKLCGPEESGVIFAEAIAACLGVTTGGDERRGSRR